MGGDDKNSNVDSLIDANLKRVYDSVLQEDVPDRFARLLDQLRSGGGEGEAHASRGINGLHDDAAALGHRGSDRPDGSE